MNDAEEDIKGCFGCVMLVVAGSCCVLVVSAIWKAIVWVWRL